MGIELSLSERKPPKREADSSLSSTDVKSMRRYTSTSPSWCLVKRQRQNYLGRLHTKVRRNDAVMFLFMFLWCYNWNDIPSDTPQNFTNRLYVKGQVKDWKVWVRFPARKLVVLSKCLCFLAKSRRRRNMSKHVHQFNNSPPSQSFRLGFISPPVSKRLWGSPSLTPNGSRGALRSGRGDEHLSTSTTEDDPSRTSED